MVFARRTALLRLTILTALVVSAILTVDTLKPGRAFCPLAEACAAARGSALGTIFGMPTSIIGILAFGGLFVLSLLPVEWARPLLKPAGLLSALAGLGFVYYQARVLESYCPLCLVADAAGVVAGLITLTWPVPPILRSGRRLPAEPQATRAAWSMAAALALVIPFAIPRPVEPAWVEITPIVDAFDEGVPNPQAVGPTREAQTDPGTDAADVAPTPEEMPAPDSTGPSVPFPPAPSEPVPSSVLSPTATPVMLATEVPAALKPPAPPAPPPLPRPTTATLRRAPSARAPTGPLLVEYLNAFCPHCRATHRRLHKVLAAVDAPMRKRRVYTWASHDYPLWARACAFAQTAGREERMFEELLRARNQGAVEVYAAARRAGLNVDRLRVALCAQKPPRRLVRDRQLVQRARISKLPTLDIGRRRLMGEQSEAELRTAVRVALNSPHP